MEDIWGRPTAYTPKLYDMSGHWLTSQGWLDAALYSGMVVPDDYNGKNFLLVGKGQLPLHRLTGRVHQSKGPVRHQRDLIPGNRLLWPEILPIVVIWYHHAVVYKNAAGRDPLDAGQ